jgi:hypothetical protein
MILCAGFSRRRRVDGERVHALPELARKCVVHHAVTLEPGLSAEGVGYDMHPEMGLSPRAMSGMAFVLVGFIHHIEARGLESFSQLLDDLIANCHGVVPQPPTFGGRSRLGYV